jgi:hypothetical protein
MEKRRIEAFLDNQARKMIADELRLLYDSIEGDIPKCFQDILKILDGPTHPSRDADAKIRMRHQLIGRYRCSMQTPILLAMTREGSGDRKQRS